MPISLKFLTSGKVKDLFDIDDETILFKFSDRVSAFDVKFNQDIPIYIISIMELRQDQLNEAGATGYIPKSGEGDEQIISILKGL